MKVERTKNQLTIIMNYEEASVTFINQIAEVIRKHSGNSTVSITINVDSAVTNINLPEKYKVNISEELISELESCGNNR